MNFQHSAPACGLILCLLIALPATSRGTLKFLFMTDHHVESDFVQSHGLSKGEPVYEMWKPGDHAALVATYRFISEDPFCRDCDFALFGGDQLNTGYLWLPADRDAELANYWRTLEALDLHAKTKGKTADFDFVARPWRMRPHGEKAGPPVEVTPAPPTSRVIALQGNHDTGTDAFCRDCAFTAGGVRFICFFASYVSLPPPPGRRFHSTAKIADETIDFVEREMAKAAADPKIRQIVLVSHWGIAPAGRNSVCPIVDACRENGWSPNRSRLIALAEKYGCRLYIHGHEHNGNFPVVRVGPMTSVNCGSVTAETGGGAFAVFEIGDDLVKVHVYSRASAEERGGRAVVTERPKKLFVREFGLKNGLRENGRE